MRTKTRRRHWTDWVAWATGWLLAYLFASSVWPDSFVILRVLGAIFAGYLLAAPLSKLLRAGLGSLRSFDG